MNLTMCLTFAKQNKKFLIKRVTSYVISQPNMKPVTVLEKICFKEVFYTHPNMAVGASSFSILPCTILIP